jgi:hypothetical protein
LAESTLNFVSFSQSKNASSPMEVTLSGKSIVSSDEQPTNALSPMVVTPSGMVTPVKPLQAANAPSPTAVSLINSPQPRQPQVTSVQIKGFKYSQFESFYLLIFYGILKLKITAD